MKVWCQVEILGTGRWEPDGFPCPQGFAAYNVKEVARNYVLVYFLFSWL